jgi:hypothetical protein
MTATKDLSLFNRKRLIVCCDGMCGVSMGVGGIVSIYDRTIGTGENSIGDSFQPPSNVTRMCRALSPEAKIKEDGIEKRIPQIVYYQKGVGTGLLEDKLGGGKW